MSNMIKDYEAFVAKLYNRTGDMSKDFTHAILGILTEIDELFAATDAVNAREEKGDLQFYVVALRMVIDEMGPAVPTGADPFALFPELVGRLVTLSPQELLSKLSTELMDDAKRWIGYGKQPKDFHEVFFKATVAANTAIALSPFTSDTLDDVLRANMAKLLVRYPGGEFDAYRAVQRDLGAERDVLEQH